jgi:hypothetical protein
MDSHKPPRTQEEFDRWTGGREADVNREYWMLIVGTYHHELAIHAVTHAIVDDFLDDSGELMATEATAAYLRSTPDVPS